MEDIWAFREQYLAERMELLSLANIKYILSFNKLSSRKLKLLSDQDYYLYENLGAYPRAQVGNGTADIIKYEPQRVEIEVRVAEDDALVLADNYYPGWRAFVNGKETRIDRANYLFRSVSVPRGEHRVLFVYDPLSVKIGAGISLASLIGLAGTALFIFLRRKTLV